MAFEGDVGIHQLAQEASALARGDAPVQKVMAAIKVREQAKTDLDALDKWGVSAEPINLGKGEKMRKEERSSNIESAKKGEEIEKKRAIKKRVKLMGEECKNSVQQE